jgi:hypothetical protein
MTVERPWSSDDRVQEVVLPEEDSAGLLMIQEVDNAAQAEIGPGPPPRL